MNETVQNTKLAAKKAVKTTAYKKVVVPPTKRAAKAPVALAPTDGRAKAPQSGSRLALRTNDPERTMANILEVATHDFSENGLAGARIDEIAGAMRTSKRMIYYYFGSKEGLYLSVLENAYQRIRTIEADLHLEDLPPMEALSKLVAHTVDYQFANPDFVRLVMNENMLKGAYIARSKAIQKLNVPAIDRLREVYERGVQAGVFRAGLDAVDLHMTISAFAVFNVANRHTFSVIFKRDMADPKVFAARKAVIVETLQRFVQR